MFEDWSTKEIQTDYCIGHLEHELHETFASSLVYNDGFVCYEQTEHYKYLDLYYDEIEEINHDLNISKCGGCTTISRTPLVVFGPEGTGKSSLLANWVTRHKARACDRITRKASCRLDRDEFIFYHVAGCSRNSCYVYNMLRRLLNGLKEHFDLQSAGHNIDQIPDDRLPWNFPRILQDAAVRGRILIIIDGLQHLRGDIDEANECGNLKGEAIGTDLNWLPRSFPSNVRVIMSVTTTCSNNNSDLNSWDDNSNQNNNMRHIEKRKSRVVDEVKRREWRVLEIKQFDSTAIEYIVSNVVRILIDKTCKHQIAKTRKKSMKPEEADKGNEDIYKLEYFQGTIESIKNHSNTNNARFLMILLQLYALTSNRYEDSLLHLESCLGRVNSTSMLIHQFLDIIELGQGIKTQSKHIGMQSSPFKPDASSKLSNKVISPKSSVDSYRFNKTVDLGGTKKIGSVSHIKAQHRNEVKSLDFRTSHSYAYDGLGQVLGKSLSLLFVARHGLHEKELFDLLERVELNDKWKQKTEGTTFTIEYKLFQCLSQNKKRLIDIFRSFDEDGNGTLSHDEFFKGMGRLDIGVTNKEIKSLIDLVDTNHDGEIDYRETLNYFERQSRKFNHGKRKGSLLTVATHEGHPMKDQRNKMNDTSYSCKKISKKHLLTTLTSLGVILLRSNSTLILPIENMTFRNLIWHRYIKTKDGLDRWHRLLIEYFMDQEPSLRRCEELPWHLKKCRKWTTLRQTLLDLRTFDIMYNGSTFKAELFDYLLLLSEGMNNHKTKLKVKRENGIGLEGCSRKFDTSNVGKGQSLSQQTSFDLVDEMNRAVELWYHGTNPSTIRLEAMISMIAEFFAWFSKKMSHYVEPPSLMRKPINLEQIKNIGVDKCTPTHFLYLMNARERQDEKTMKDHRILEGKYNGETITSSSTKPEASNMTKNTTYLFDRWIWIQYPWLALKNALLQYENMNETNKRMSLERKDDSCTEENKLNHTKLRSVNEIVSFPDNKKPKNVFSNNGSTLELHSCINRHDKDKHIKKSECTSQRRFPIHPHKVSAEIEKRKSPSVQVEQRKAQINERNLNTNSNLKQKKIFALTDEDLEMEAAITKVGKMRTILDKTKVDLNKKREILIGLNQTISECIKGGKQFQEIIEREQGSLHDLIEKLDKISFAVSYATNIGKFYDKIEESLVKSNPSLDNHHLETLEQQVVLTRQQKVDLMKKLEEVNEEKDRIIHTEIAKLKENEKNINISRSKLKPKMQAVKRRNNLQNNYAGSFRLSVMDINALGMAARSPARRRRSTVIASSLFVRQAGVGSLPITEGINIGESEKRNIVEDGIDNSNIHKVDFVHPMETIFNISGKQSVDEIIKVVNKHKSNEEELKKHRAVIENRISELDNQLHRQLKHLEGIELVGDEDSKTKSTGVHDTKSCLLEEIGNGEKRCSDLKKKIETLEYLITSVSSGMSHINQLVLPKKSSHLRKISRRSTFKGGAMKVDMLESFKTTAKILSKKIGLSDSHSQNVNCIQEYGSNVQTLKDNIEYRRGHIRILNKDEVESRFEENMEQLAKQEDKNIYENDQFREFEESVEINVEQVKEFVNDALNTNKSRNELRRANILTEDKQGKNAKKGIAIEAILRENGQLPCYET